MRSTPITPPLQALLGAPSYRIAEAAVYLCIPTATLRSWTRGQPYRLQDGRVRRFLPIIQLPAGDPPRLSFMNLLESHVVNALRRKGLPFQKVRRALEYLNKHFPSPHPLLDRDFLTDGWSILIDHMRTLVNITSDGQIEMKEIVAAHLQRIARNTQGLPVRFYPFTRRGHADDPRSVVIDPRLSFGRPVMVGTGVPVEEIVGRHKAGESIRALAEDYDRRPEDIEEALRFLDAA